MYSKKNSFLAIIPARSGSKRLKNKNILPLKGKPLIEYSIQAAKNCHYINQIIVTSDCDKILAISKKLSIQTIKRPNYLSNDFSTTFDTIKHVIENTELFEYIVLLQPTSPLRTSFHIDQAILLLKEKKADAIVSVVEMEHSPLWANTINDDLDMSSFLNTTTENKRSQELAPYYRINGAIYICKTSVLLNEKTFFPKKNIFAYIMPQLSSVDIDNKIDFLLAQTILENS